MRMSNDVNDNYVKQYTGPYGPVVGLSPDDGRPKVETSAGGTGGLRQGKKVKPLWLDSWLEMEPRVLRKTEGEEIASPVQG